MMIIILRDNYYFSGHFYLSVYDLRSKLIYRYHLGMTTKSIVNLQVNSKIMTTVVIDKNNIYSNKDKGINLSIYIYI